ncbi:hypothetical protein ECB96_06625 [Helicobacter pylori]|nr:hypothetical protein ECB96_06625 [Helicobacter pylori]
MGFWGFKWFYVFLDFYSLFFILYSLFFILYSLFFRWCCFLFLLCLSFLVGGFVGFAFRFLEPI